AENRGRFSLSVQVLFAIGLLVVALVSVYVVPHWGWRWMFVIGAIPALVAIPMRTVLPESPRWLASQGRADEADRVLTRIENTAARDGKLVPPLPKDLPEVPKLARALLNCSGASICVAPYQCGLFGLAPISCPMASPPGCPRCSALSIILM